MSTSTSPSKARVIDEAAMPAAGSAGHMFIAAAAALALPCLVLAATYKAHTYYGLPITTLTRDPSAVADVPWYVGAVSHIGVLHWCAAAVVCAFSALLLRGLRQTLFFGCAAGLSAILMFDDLFMLHEAVGPQLFSIGEKNFLAIDGALLLLFLVVFRRDLQRHPWPLLAAAFGFFAASLAVDQLGRYDDNLHALAEGGGKLLGAAMWLGFFVCAAIRALTTADVVMPRPTCE